MNECFFMGNITKDPVLREVGTNKTAVVSFTVAVNRVYKRSSGESVKETVFVDCEAWDSGAETINRHFKAGHPIAVSCSYNPNRWEDKETGQKRLSPRFRVNRFYFPPSKPRSEHTDGVDTTEAPVGAGAEGDIPF